MRHSVWRSKKQRKRLRLESWKKRPKKSVSANSSSPDKKQNGYEKKNRSGKNVRRDADKSRSRKNKNALKRSASKKKNVRGWQKKSEGRRNWSSNR